MEKGRSQCLGTTPSPNNPYTTLPPPTDSFVQLCFQLAGFNGVYHVAQVPLNYTFATLYKLVLFMFGWHGMHAHKACVYSFVETYSGRRAGQIKRFGREGVVSGTEYICPEVAEYNVVVKGDLSGWRRVEFEETYDAEEQVEDQDLHVLQVWNPDVDCNGSGGGCGNMEMGVIYEYDFGGISPLCS
jgi:hypothetical protein